MPALPFIKTPLKGVSRSEWLQMRRMGIGGTDTSAILGLNEYECSAEVFYDKVGYIPREGVGNMAMLMGRELEPIITRLWEHYDPQRDDPALLVSRYEVGEKVRRAQTVKDMYWSRKHRHMFANPDRLFVHVEDGKAHRRCPLELKSISGWAAQKWDAGVPPQYVIQVMHYMVVMGARHAELAILQDGRNLTVHHFNYDEKIAKEIIERTRDFWDLVRQGREVYSEFRYMIHHEQDPEQKRLLQIELENQMASLCPPPDGSVAYEAFLSKRHPNSSDLAVSPTPEVLRWVQSLCDIKEKAASLEEALRLEQNKIKAYMGTAGELQLGNAGKITWRTAKDGSRRFNVRVKPQELQAVDPISF